MPTAVSKKPSFEQDPGVVYLAVREWFRITIGIFYNGGTSGEHVVGHENVPKAGAVIVAPNHSNSLGDAMVMLPSFPRTLRLTAKDTLWKNPLWRFFVSSTGTVPIKRRKDHVGADGKGNVDNTDAFQALFDTLASKACICMFPEGISRYHPKVAPVRSGVATIAIQFVRQRVEAGATGDDACVHIVPAGICYLHPEKFRSPVLVQLCKAIRVDATMLGADAEADRKLVADLTARLDGEIRTHKIDADEWETVRLAHLCQRVFQPDRISLQDFVNQTAKFAAFLGREGQTDSEKATIGKLRQDLESYHAELEALGVKHNRVMQTINPVVIAKRAVVRFFGALLLLGLAAPGFVAALPVLLVWRMKDAQLRRAGVVDNLDEAAQWKMLMVSFLFPGLGFFYAIIAWLGGLSIGPFGGLFLALVITVMFPFFLWFTTRFFEDGISSLRALLSLTRLLKSSMSRSQRLSKLRESVPELEKRVGDLAKELSITPAPKAPRRRKRAFFNPWQRTVKDWNETMRLYDVPLGSPLVRGAAMNKNKHL